MFNYARKRKINYKKSIRVSAKGKVVFLMKEKEIVNYISDICQKYEGTSEQIIKKMTIAGLLETMGIINVNTPEKNKNRKTIYKAQVNSDEFKNTNYRK